MDANALPSLDGPRVEPADGGTPRALVILLHGLGADGNDLIGLAPHLAPVLPGARFISPNAPEPCDMAPFGRQWFSLQDRDPRAMAAGVASVAPILNAFIDAELESAGLTPDKLALVGFSQGTMTSLHVAPRRPAPIAGVLGYSGAVLDGGTLGIETVSTPPVCLIHGTADEVVPFQAMAAAESALQTVGMHVDSHARPGLGHGIDGEGLAVGAAFLQRILGA